MVVALAFAIVLPRHAITIRPPGTVSMILPVDGLGVGELDNEPVGVGDGDGEMDPEGEPVGVEEPLGVGVGVGEAVHRAAYCLSVDADVDVLDPRWRGQRG